MDPREDDMMQTATSWKVDERNGIICLVSFLTFVVLKLPKNVYFLQFFISFLLLAIYV